MTLKPDQERIKSLLSETITLLCRNGLNFKSEFSVEALIGITLDHSDVFLVNIKETVKSAEPATVIPEAATTWEESTVNHRNTGSSGESKRLDAMRKDRTNFRLSKRNDASFGYSPYSQNSMRRLVSSSTAWEDNCVSREMSRRYNLLDDNDASASRVKRARIDLPTTAITEKTDNGKKERSLNPREIGDIQEDKEMQSIILDENSTRNDSPQSSPRLGASNVKCEPPLERRPRSPGNRKRPSSVDGQSLVKQKILSYVGESDELLENSVETQNDDSETDEVVFVKNEPNEFRASNVSDTNGSYDMWTRDTSKQWSENTRDKSGDWMGKDDLLGGSSGTSGQHRPNRRGYRSRVAGQLTETVGSSYEFDGMDMTLACNASSSVVSNLSSNYSVDLPEENTVPRAIGAPDLSEYELIIARSVLSMRGSFISIGCLKANRQLIRRVSREHLMAIINKMSTPTDPAYFIGLLFDFGISRVFYKCPPATVSDAALTFYGFSGARYEDCYLRKVIVDKNIRDPETWIQKLQERSPFVRQ